MSDTRLITIAIHTFDRAQRLRTILESEGIPVTLQNVNLTSPTTAAGVRLRISSDDLPRALRLIESIQIISPEFAAQYPQDGPTILVPIDFGEATREVIRLGFKLASAHKARLILLHTFLDPGLIDTSALQLSDSLTFDTSSSLAEEADIEMGRIEQQSADSRLAQLAKSLKEEIASGALPKVSFETCLEEGLPEEVIDTYNTRYHPLVIIMATNSSSHESRALSGSITGEVLNAAEATVLTIPRNYEEELLTAGSHVAFFSTSRQDDILALDTFARLFPALNLKVTLVTLPSRRVHSADTSEQLADYCRSEYPTFTFSTASLGADTPEADFERINGADPVRLIVFPNRRKNVIARMFSPTLAHRLLFNTPLPLLAVAL